MVSRPPRFAGQRIAPGNSPRLFLWERQRAGRLWMDLVDRRAQLARRMRCCRPAALAYFLSSRGMQRQRGPGTNHMRRDPTFCEKVSTECHFDGALDSLKHACQYPETKVKFTTFRVSLVCPV